MLIRNRSKPLHSELVVNYRCSEHFSPVCRLELVVDRFDGQPGEPVVLDAEWSVIEAASGKLGAVKT